VIRLGTFYSENITCELLTNAASFMADNLFNHKMVGIEAPSADTDDEAVPTLTVNADTSAAFGTLYERRLVARVLRGSAASLGLEAALACSLLGSERANKLLYGAERIEEGSWWEVGEDRMWLLSGSSFTDIWTSVPEYHFADNCLDKSMPVPKLWPSSSSNARLSVKAWAHRSTRGPTCSM
jgi:hypothetical protein